MSSLWNKIEQLGEAIPELFIYSEERPLLYNSGEFLLFFTLFFWGYLYLARNYRWRILFTTFFSLYFYYKTGGLWFGLLVGITLWDYLLALWLARTATPFKRKAVLFLSLLGNLSLLSFFKYTNLFAEFVANLAGREFSPYAIYLPVGISFFIFQSLSYTIDVYRRKIEPLRWYPTYLFYVSFFPQLVAGPIVRAQVFLPQIRKKLQVSAEMVASGWFLIIAGLIKKVLISDYIGTNIVDLVFDDPLKYSGAMNLWAVYAYGLQIFCDFSGYSDIAIGLAALMGYKFPPNFDSPYQAISLQTFWRRWHISLSSWLRDYLYISLGGNKKGRSRTYINIMLTMFLGGLWHGAAWRFALWGVLHGAFLCIERFFIQRRSHHEVPLGVHYFRIFGGWFISFHFVTLCWICFRAESLSQMSDILLQISYSFSFSQFQEIFEVLPTASWVVVIGYCLHFLPKRVKELAQRKSQLVPSPIMVVILFLLIIVLNQVQGDDVIPFVYFQF